MNGDTAMARRRTTSTTVTAPRERLTGPTPDRGRRGEDIDSYSDAGMPKHRLRGGFQTLYESGDIDQNLHNAGLRWRRDTEFGLHNANDPSPGGGGGELCRDDYRLLALTRWRRASAALGEERSSIMNLFAVECLSFAAVARLVACSRARLAEDARMAAARAAGIEANRHLTPLPGNGSRQASAYQPVLDGLPKDRETLKLRLVEALETLSSHYDCEERVRRALDRARRAA